MPEKITKKEMLVITAIAKAKTILQDAQHLGILENKEPVDGKETKVKRPKKKPAKEKLDNPIATDDVNSGYGHVGDKEYFGKAMSEIKKIHPELEGLLDKIQQEIKEATDPKAKEQYTQQLHEILQEILQDPDVISSGPSMDSEFRTEDETEQHRGKPSSYDMNDEWKAVLKVENEPIYDPEQAQWSQGGSLQIDQDPSRNRRPDMAYPTDYNQEYQDKITEEELTAWNEQAGNKDKPWTKEQIMGSSTEGPNFRRWQMQQQGINPDKLDEGLSYSEREAAAEKRSQAMDERMYGPQ